ncbi:MAG TPA: RQC domain-containing protein, partial [Tichowtungia sp.]|nr:RQC domain-containing protein [Tichowtungia sp.]
RRKNILGYFGETYPKEDCGTCDVCTGQVERFDATIDAQKILSAIYRTGGRFGAVHIADIVAGADTQRIRQFGHDKIKTYGVGKDRDKRHWRRIIDALIAQDCIRLSDDQYPVLQLADKAARILRGQKKFWILFQKKTKASRRTLPAGDFSPGLFDVLRDKRKRLARDLGVPPFVVFSDKTLHEMARYFPSTQAELRQISGVGDSKLKRFGDPFLAAIVSYMEANPKETESRSVLQVPLPGVRKKKPKGETIRETLSLAREGLNVEQICARRGLTPTTITQHIEKGVGQGETLDVDQFIAPEKRIEIEELFKRLNVDTLGAVVEASGGSVTYEQARLVRAFM